MALTYDEKKALMERLESLCKDAKDIKKALDKEFEDTETPLEEPKAEEEPEAVDE